MVHDWKRGSPAGVLVEVYSGKDSIEKREGE